MTLNKFNGEGQKLKKKKKSRVLPAHLLTSKSSRFGMGVVEQQLFGSESDWK